MRAAMIATLFLASVSMAAAKDPIAAATNAMAEADFDKALALLDAALPKARGADAVKIQLMRGEALVALQRVDDAIKAFSAALAIDPAAELAASTVSPDAVNALSKARRLILSDLVVNIAGGAKANVKVDEAELGPAPLKTRVGAGPHRIEVVGSAGEKATKEIDVLPGRPMVLTLELPVAAASLPPPPMPQPAGTEAPPAATATARSSGGSKVGFIPIGVGVAVLGAGVACLALASGNHAQLVDQSGPRLDSATEARLASEGATFQAVGFAGIGIGVAAAVAGTAMLLFLPGSEKSVHVAVAPSSSGGTLGLTGTFEEVPR